jgi:cytochrome c556
MSRALRSFGCCAALAVGLSALTSAAADAPNLPKDSVKKAADADVKFLQTRLAELAKKQAAGEKVLDGRVKPALGTAMAVAAYGDSLGDAGLKGDSLKLVEAIAKKDFKTADALAKKLAVKPGAAGKPGAPPKTALKDEQLLEAAMSPFRGQSVGGLNIDKDIKDWSKANSKIDPAAVEILAIRSAVLNAYAFHAPNDKAKTNPNNQKLWEKFAGETTDTAQKLAAEAGKGAKADEKSIRKLLSGLNARCSDCHEKFRDE